MRRTLLIAACATAVPVLTSTGQSNAAPTRVKWPAASLLVYADSSDGVKLWLATNAGAVREGDRVRADVKEGFDPDSVMRWVTQTAELLGVAASAAPRDTMPYVSLGALRGRHGAVLLAARMREGDGLQDGARLLVLPTSGAPLRFDVDQSQLRTLLGALASAAPRARTTPACDTVANESAPRLDMSRARPVPKYPDNLKRADIEGEVWMEFRIDTLGRAEPETFRTLFADHADFDRAVRTFLAGARFIPAQRDGHPVASVVQQRTTFNLTY